MRKSYDLPVLVTVKMLPPLVNELPNRAAKTTAVRTMYAKYSTLLLRLPVGRGGIINSPRSVFLGFFGCRKLGYRLWVIPLCSILIAILSPCQHDFKLNF